MNFLFYHLRKKVENNQHLLRKELMLIVFLLFTISLQLAYFFKKIPDRLRKYRKFVSKRLIEIFLLKRNEKVVVGDGLFILSSTKKG